MMEAGITFEKRLGDVGDRYVLSKGKAASGSKSSEKSVQHPRTDGIIKKYTAASKCGRGVL